ncbi:MAG: DUF3857 domain-containing protein [Phycisphaerae bacterium]|jgi:hypothetical protein
MHSAKHTLRPPALATRALLVALTVALAAPALAAPPDAVIELWEQQWTLKADGSTAYYCKQHVRLNNDRAYREFADPRITYNADTDELEIINARVKRADGTYRDLADYSHVLVTPDSTSGWPAFAAIRQHLLVMSGIEVGCVVELEYRITSKPGTYPYIAADVRCDHRHPVQEHTLTIATPDGVKLSCVSFSQVPPTDGNASYTLRSAAGVPHEPQSPPWWTRNEPGMRLTFSTAGTTEEWLKTTLGWIDSAADESPLVSRLAHEWAEEPLSPADKMRAIQEKLADCYSFVEFEQSWRPFTLRPASETMSVCYGMPEEAAAALLSLARAAGLPVRPAVLVDDERWTDRAPQRDLVSAYVVLLDNGPVPQVWDPHRGRIQHNARWAGYTVLAQRETAVQRILLPAWDDVNDSRCVVRGDIKIADDGTYTGNLTVETTGLFVSPESLRTTGGQNSRVRALVRRVLPSVDVESSTVTALADGRFAVEAKVKSSNELEQTAGAFWLPLDADGPARAEVPLPTNYSQRTQPVRLTGPYEELLDLTITWPEGWTVEVRPHNVSAKNESGSLVQQQVIDEESGLKLQRRTRLAQRQLTAADFLALRDALNEMATDAGRTIILRP